MYKLSKRSLNKLKGVHVDLVLVVVRALQICKIDFVVVEGLRTKEQQMTYVNQGKSKTMNSRHITGHAVDLAPWEAGKIPWEDFSKFKLVADAMLQASKELDIPIRWGADWDRDGSTEDETFIDGPHFELLKSAYPG